MKAKVEPCPSPGLSAQIRPPCAWTMDSGRSSVQCRCLRPPVSETYPPGRNGRRHAPGARLPMPAPVSLTEQRTNPPSSLLRSLPARPGVCIARHFPPGSSAPARCGAHPARTGGKPSGNMGFQDHALIVILAAQALDDRLRQAFNTSTGLQVKLICACLYPAELLQVLHQAPQALGFTVNLLDTSRSRAATRHRSRPSAEPRMVVRGVRSSCATSPINWRRMALGLLQALRHLIEAERQPPQLIQLGFRFARGSATRSL